MSIMILSGKHFGYVEDYLIKKFTEGGHPSFIVSRWYQCERTTESIRNHIQQTILDWQQLLYDSYNGKYGEGEKPEPFIYPANEADKLDDLQVIKALKSIEYQIEEDFCDMEKYSNVEALDILDRMIGKLCSSIVHKLPSYDKCKGHDII